MSSQILGITGIGEIIVAFALLSTLGSVATYVIIVVANRADPDPTGKRPMSVYLFAGAFVMLWVAVIGAIAIVVSAVSLIGTNTYEGFSNSIHPIGDAAVRAISAGVLLVLIAGAAHYLHRSRGLALSESESDPASPSKRVARSYVAVVSFVSVLIMYAAFFAVLYSLLRTIAPGVYLGGSRISSLRDILDELFILLVGIYIFATHQRMAPVGLRLLGQRRPKPTVTVSEITE